MKEFMYSNTRTEDYVSLETVINELRSNKTLQNVRIKDFDAIIFYEDENGEEKELQMFW